MITPGLQRISRLLAQTPLPWRAVHVAGTNGKGSICAYISAMLSAYNRPPNLSNQIRHGRFTSPHLIDRWDCITIDNAPVSESAFKAVEKEVLERDRSMEIGASEFEVLTATAFELFTREYVRVAVVEVGMGGRLDATNLLGQMGDVKRPPKGVRLRDFRPPPLVSVISSIGLDHQGFLGNTLEEIAREKAGIIKHGVPVVFDRSNSREVIDVIESVAEENGSAIVVTQPSIATGRLLEGSSPRERLRLAEHFQKILSRDDPKNRIPTHVKQNLTLAYLATWTVLQEIGRLNHLKASTPAKTRSEVRKLVEQMFKAAKTTFPGRQQLISIEKLTGRKQDILLDGAHNAQSAAALADTVNEMRQQTEKGKVTWVLAASDTKDVKALLSPLLRDGDAVFATKFGPVDGMPWVKPLSAPKILNAAREVIGGSESLHTRYQNKVVLSALKKASVEANGGTMVVAGSLYLVGDVLRLLRDG